MAAAKILKRIAITTYLVVVHVLAAFFIWQTIFPAGIGSLSSRPQTVADPARSPDAPTPLPVPSILVSPSETPVSEQSEPAVPTSPEGLLVPVRGIRPDQLVDTFSDARSEGRVHDAIDIPAPAGTPVVAAAGGSIVKFFDSRRGGTTIYEISADKRYFFYYAHLQGRAAGLKEGDTVARGTVIGYVGDSGNAGPGNFHLHFAISLVGDPKRFWQGNAIDPFPYLRNGQPLP